MLQLSDNPIIQKQQLAELIERSNHYIKTLIHTPVFFEEEQRIRLYKDGESRFDYNPPKLRFASAKTFKFLVEDNY